MKLATCKFIMIMLIVINTLSPRKVSLGPKPQSTPAQQLEGDITFTNTVKDLFAYSHYLSHILAYDTANTNKLTALGREIQLLDSAVAINSKVVDGVNYEGRAIIGKSIKMPNILVIIFRGTDNKCNGIEDGRIAKTAITNKTFKTFKDAKVHEGFMNVYKSLRDDVRKTVLDLLTANKNIDSIFITGHSLGGALANLCAVDMDFYYNKGEGKKIIPDGYDFNLVTFGSPRVGDPVFAKYVNNIPRMSRNVRVVFKEDLVSQIPLTQDFVHAGTLAVFDGENWKLEAFQVDKSPRLSVAEAIIDPVGLSSWAENLIDLIDCNTSAWEAIKKISLKQAASGIWLVFKTTFKLATDSDSLDAAIKLKAMGDNHSQYKKIFPFQMGKLNELYEAASGKKGATGKKKRNLRKD